MAIPNKAITRNEQYLAAMAGQSGTLPEEPITRKEHYLAKAAGQSVETPNPITREEMYLDAIAEGGGGGGEAVLINKTVTANGTYLPAADSADGYKKVVVNVSTPTPTLMPKTITENGIYLPQDDGADGYDTVTVDVTGGGEKTLTKLTEISISEPVSTIAITATDAMKSCDRLYIKLKNVTLSADDWVYLYINDDPGSIPSQNMGYIGKAQTYAALFELIRFGGAVDGSVIETAYQFGPNRLVTTANTRLADSLTEINFRLYTAGTTFNSGTIEVWGYAQ